MKFFALLLAVLSTQAFALEDGRYHSEQPYCDLLVVSSGDTITTQGTDWKGTPCPSDEVKVYRLASTGKFHLTVPDSDRLYKQSFIIPGTNMLMLQHYNYGISRATYRKID